MGKVDMMKEAMDYLKHHKRLWLLPIVIIILLFAVVLLFTEGIDLVPFIYAVR